MRVVLLQIPSRSVQQFNNDKAKIGNDTSAAQQERL
jgi:hypothetical protein